MEIEFLYGQSYLYVQIDMLGASNWAIANVSVAVDGLNIDTVNVTDSISDVLKHHINEKISMHLANAKEPRAEAKADRYNDDLKS